MPIHPKRVKEGFPPFYEAGHIIEHPYAYKLVRAGVAIPADNECEERCKPILGRMDEIVFAGERRERGIHYEDFDAYKRGLMVGYKPDGTEGDSWIHGPNFYEGCEAEYYSGDEEEDDDE